MIFENVKHRINLYVGDIGCGKTLTMVADSIKFIKQGYKIYTNLEMNGKLKKHCKTLTSDEIISLINNDKLKNEVRNCVLAIDEIQTLFDSRRSSKKENLDFGYFVQQIRKRQIILLATAQNLEDIDLRFRNRIHTLIEPEIFILPSGRYCVSVLYRSIITERNRGFHLESKRKYNPKPIFELFDTTQEQKSINVK